MVVENAGDGRVPNSVYKDGVEAVQGHLRDLQMSPRDSRGFPAPVNTKFYGAHMTDQQNAPRKAAQGSTSSPLQQCDPALRSGADSVSSGAKPESGSTTDSSITSPAASSLMGGLAADMQARILALQASRPRRQSTSSKGSLSRTPSDGVSRNSSTASLVTSPLAGGEPSDNGKPSLGSPAGSQGTFPVNGHIPGGAVPGAVPSGALALGRMPSRRGVKRTASLSERRGMKLNPPTVPTEKHPSEPTIRSGAGDASFRMPDVPASSAALHRPKLHLQDTQAPGVLGTPRSQKIKAPAGKAYNGLFSAYKKYIDIETGSLNFSGKAVLHSQGIDFSSGTSFRITLDELEPLSELGAGNYGTVTMVLHKPTNVRMAMKEIRLELAEANFQQIIMELDILHRCDVNYIVEFYGAFFVESAVYVCMEYMDGSSVNTIYGDGIPEKCLAYIVRAVILGLKQLKDEHQIIHRDIKPTNILCSTQGSIKLCDFGVSGNLVASMAKTNIGCQAYMAPERIRTSANTQNAKYTVESDVWSLGLSIIEMAEGCYPYPPESYANIFSQLSAIVDGKAPHLNPRKFSPEACSFVAACLKKDPRGRPTYAELLSHPWLSNLECDSTMMGQFVRERLATIKDKSTS